MDFIYNDYTYQIYSDGKSLIVATATYGGKTIRGTAKCSEGDDFDYEKGAALAAARCAYKIAKKKVARATRQYRDAAIVASAAKVRLDEMTEYLEDATETLAYERQMVETMSKDLA